MPHVPIELLSSEAPPKLSNPCLSSGRDIASILCTSDSSITEVDGRGGRDFFNTIVPCVVGPCVVGPCVSCADGS